MCTLDVEIISVAILHIYDYHNLIKWSDMSTSFFLFNKATIFVNNIHVFISHAVFLLFWHPATSLTTACQITPNFDLCYTWVHQHEVSTVHTHIEGRTYTVCICSIRAVFPLFPAECSDVRLSCVICRDDETTVRIRDSDPACSNIHWSHMCALALVPTVLCSYALVIHQT